MTQPATPPPAVPAAVPPTTGPAAPPTTGPQGQPAPAQPGTPAAPAAAADDRPLGPAGEKALAAEREARKELEKKLAALMPLQRIAELVAAPAEGAPAGIQQDPVAALQARLAKHEEQLGTERAARYRAEVAAEAGLTSDQASRLRGTTKEELLADATLLRQQFPAAPATPGPAGPRPDLTQGAHGGPVDVDAQIRAAQAKGDWREALRLQNSKLAI
jgi:hypothetical protein